MSENQDLQKQNKMLNKLLGVDEFSKSAHSKLNSVIESYCVECTTDYALALVGNWGCGKTYYVKNELKKLIEEKMNFHFIYISLNGISSFDEIKKKIIIKTICSSEGEKIIDYDDIESLLDCVASVPYIDKFIEPFIKLKEMSEDKIVKFMNYEKIFIVFDDKERISSTTNLVDILGQIYENYIIKGAKTLFVSNEEKIKGEEYHSTKEKFIQRTLIYKPKFLPQIKNFIRNQYEPSAIERYFGPNMDFILNSLANLQIRNLRTIKFILNNYQYVLKSVDPDLHSKCSEFIFKNIMILSNEFKEGKISTKDMKKKAGLIQNNYSWLTLKEKDEDKKTYADKFYEKYNDKFNLGFVYVDSIFEFIITGYLDSKKLNKEIKEFFNDEGQEEKSIIGKLIHFRELEEDELSEYFEKLIISLKNGKFFTPELPNIYCLIRDIESYQYFPTSKYDLGDIFNAAFTKASQNDFRYIHIQRMGQWSFPNQKEDVLYSEIKTRTDDLKHNNQDKLEKKRINDIFDKKIDDDNFYTLIDSDINSNVPTSARLHEA